MLIMPKINWNDDYRGFLYEFSINTTFLVNKIICLLTTRLKLEMIGFKDTKEGDKLIFQCSNTKLRICPFWRQSQF